MDKKQFEEVVENELIRVHNDMQAANDLQKRGEAVKNLKVVSDIWLDYQKMEYEHEENLGKLDNESLKIKLEDKRKEHDEDLKYAQIQSDNKNKKWETIVKVGMYGVKAIILIGGIVACHRFETGGTFGSTLARSIYPSFGRVIADDVTRI